MISQKNGEGHMAFFSRRISLSLLSVALLGLVLAGCNDGTVNTNAEKRENNGGTAPQASDQYFMVPAGSTDLLGNVTEPVRLQVFMYSTRTGDAVPDQRISFEILSDDSEQATLSAMNGLTDEDGLATVELRPSAEPSQVSVQANHDSANAVDFQVDFEPLETGDLTVTLTNSGASILNLSDIDTRLYRDSQTSCAEFRPLSPRHPDELATYVAGTVNEDVEFNDLGTRQRFMVTAVARGSAGQIAAAGCADGINIDAEQVTEQELVLQLIPLNPVGRYDVTAHWDFTEALADSGTVGSTIVRVLDIFENPGQGLYDELINMIQNFVGVAGVAFDWFMDASGLEGMLVDAINDAIEGNDTLRKIRDAGRDVRDVVANLEVHSELTIGKMSSAYEFRGTDNWLGITLYWRWNCDSTSPPDCGAIEILADGNGDFGELGVLSSEWTGRVTAYNQLQIDMHPLSLRYGRLIQYVLNEVILPEMTDGNANSLGDAFTYWVCDGLVSRVADSNGEVCAGSNCIDAQYYCETAVSTVFGFADLLVSNLEYDLGMRIGGEGRLVETTSDGFVDFIEDGEFNGYMQNVDLGQQQASPIEATWSAERIDFETDNL
jgi:hypothetical protein